MVQFLASHLYPGSMATPGSFVFLGLSLPPGGLQGFCLLVNLTVGTKLSWHVPPLVRARFPRVCVVVEID